MRQILENLIERIFGPLDISQLHIESGKIGDGVEPEFPADGLNRLNEKSRHFTTARQECFVNLPAEQIGKFAEARRMQNIDEKSIVLLTDSRFVVTELNQSCFTHTARWNDNQIIAVGNRLDKPGWLAYPIAKILRSDLSGHDEWIYNLRHRNIIFCKNNYFIQIMQIE